MQKRALGMASALTVIVAIVGLAACDARPDEMTTGKPAGENGESHSPNLPELDTFETNKSSLLPIDITHVYSIAPFLGTGAQSPHQGMHFNFHDDGTFATVAEPSSYPAVYAVTDGVVTHVEPVRDMGEHQAYGIGLVVGQSRGQQATLYYSLEPFVLEPSPGFYAGFIDVVDGQHVKKGDVIGHLFVPPGTTQGTHLHLHLNVGQSNKVPALFDSTAIEAMHQKFGDPGGIEDGVTLPACTGYKVSANENPFGTGPSDCLN